MGKVNTSENMDPIKELLVNCDSILLSPLYIKIWLMMQFMISMDKDRHYSPYFHDTTTTNLKP